MVDDEEDDFPTMEMVYKFKLKIVRVINNGFFASNLKIKAELFFNDGKINNIIEKISFWFSRIVAKSIVISGENSILFDALEKTNVRNNIMMTHVDPTDDILAILFQSKMNAIADGDAYFGDVTVTSDDSGGVSFTYSGDSEEDLPTMKEWIGDRSYFEDPWWARNDATTYDIKPDEDADITIVPDWVLTFDFMDDDDDEIEINEDAVEIKNQKIIRPIFTPKVIDGGSK